ncbi:cell envelope biogenesis protein TolA [Pantoea brenneri]|uniref:cell envelope biogenesis protein TolA n=1 Tax=Pantoea brenneri TaxID=472694 RepID=UPI002448BC0A|nr:cell envelope biogenesis protein TolA [Pantoea brenneri]MDH2121933.1 cell envelope biogenesis protein TolA [Pantoea brenneri]
MSETTDLVVIEKANALTVFKSADQIEEILQKVEREVMSFVPDVTTVKGRKEIASLAYRVSQTKSYLDGLGKDLVAELKEVPKLIDANRKTVRDRLDALRDKARQPYTEWEAEQERIAAEKAAEDERLRIEAEQKAAAEALKKQIESDHEMALLLNEKFDRDAAEAKAEAERQRAAHEEEIRRQAVEKARIEAEQAAQRERDAAAKREADLKAAKEKAEADAKAAQERAEREAREAQERAERQAQEARERAEREKQAAIEAEQRKAREAEATRLAEEKRIADEAAARAADVAHRKAVNNKALADLVAVGLTEELARTVITAIAKGEVHAIRITY